MFDTVRTIHSALGTDSAAVFVIVVALVFAVVGGGLAFIVDKAYKNEQARQVASSKTEDAQKATPSLRQRTLALSNEIEKFMANRERGEPKIVMGTSEEFRKSGERGVEYSNETVRLYRTRFTGEVNAIIAELKFAGVDISYVEPYAQHPTNPLGVKIVAIQLATLAGGLPE